MPLPRSASLVVFTLLFVPNSCRDYLMLIVYYLSIIFYIIRQKISTPNGQIIASYSMQINICKLLLKTVLCVIEFRSRYGSLRENKKV